MIWYKPGVSTQLAITATCLSAFLLFGYDQGVFGGLITNEDFLATFNQPSTSFLSIIVSIYNIGCLIGACINVFAGKWSGRRRAIWAAMTFIALGAVLQCSAFNVGQLMLGRVITGIGVGIDTSTVPMYQSELCKPNVRGRLVTTEVLFTGLGVTIAYFFVYGMSYTSGPIAWRLPISMQIPPTFIISVLVMGLPESPRWLVQKDRIPEAVSIMAHVFNADENDEVVQSEKNAMIAAVALEQSKPFKWSSAFKTDSVRTGYRIFLACLVLFMNQWAGINVIVFYAPTVMEQSVGLSDNMALITAGFLNLSFAIGSLIPALKLDTWGRKKPMMGGALGMAISMMLIAILLSFEGTEHAQTMANASIAFFVTFMLSFGASLNAIPWCYSAEILPLHVRSQGTSISVMVNWICVFTIVMVAPTMVDNIGWKTYLVFMVMNFVFIPLIYFLFPETAGLSLEEIDYLFVKRDESEVVEAMGSSSPSLSQSGEKDAVSAKKGADEVGDAQHVEQ